MTRRRRWTLLLLGSSVLAAGAGILYLGFAPAGDAAPHPFNHDRNAVWLEHRWLEREHSTRENEELVANLARHGVSYAYPHLIPFSAEGRLPPHSREQMRAFLAVARRTAPDLKVLPWVGGLRVGYRRSRAGTVHLGDLAQRQSIVAECRSLVDEGFDGVHVDIEPVDDGNDDFLALLQALRTALGPDRVLSVSAIRPGPIRIPLAPNFFWTHAYYVRLGRYADQLVVMAYDTGLPSATLYRRYLTYVARSVTSSLLAADSSSRLLVGIPTYKESGLMHRAGVETPENAILGVVAGLRGLGPRGTFEGLALYAEWTTDPADWSIYERLWRGRPDGQADAPPAASR
jgi:glycosyl hydrolase family 18 (putative chitinase)